VLINGTELKMSKITNKELLRIFPTLIFKGIIEDTDLLDQIEQQIISLKNARRGSLTRDKFSTEDNIHLMPQFQPIVDLVMQESSEVLDFYAVKRDSHYITNMWSHVRHPVHIHPNSYLSGIVYIKTPNNCGNTVFMDPRAGSNIIHPEFHEQNYFNMNAFIHAPKRGAMLIWPSWLPHMVDQSVEEIDEERIVVAFNIMIKGAVQTKTESIVF